MGFIINCIGINIVKGFFQEVGKDLYNKGYKYLLKAKTTFFQKATKDTTLKEIEVKDKNNDKLMCKIKREDFDKYIIEVSNESKDSATIKVHLDKGLPIQYANIKVNDKIENVNDIKKADEEENKYDNIKLSVSYEKKMTFKEIKEYLNPNDIPNLIKKIEENITNKNEVDKENFRNLFENTNN
jgi:hypothetical protein